MSSAILITLGTVAFRALASTWRYRVRNAEHIERLRRNREPFIFSLWHGQLLPLIWHHRGQGVLILVSEHRDGELIARVARSIGYGEIRGSSTRGGDRALVGLVRALERGEEVAVTPDGPRGPAEHAAPGALVAAARAGARILPIAAHVDRAWRLSSWDRFIIPKPFACVTVAYGEPLSVGGAAREAAGEGERLEDAMRRAVESARA